MAILLSDNEIARLNSEAQRDERMRAWKDYVFSKSISDRERNKRIAQYRRMARQQNLEWPPLLRYAAKNKALKQGTEGGDHNTVRLSEDEYRRRKRRGKVKPPIVPVVAIILVTFMIINFADLGGYSSFIPMTLEHRSIIYSFVEAFKEQQTQNSQTSTEFTVTISNSEMAKMLMEKFNCTEAKANGLAACYEALSSMGFTPEQAVTFMGCAMHEGAPGLVQYGFPKDSHFRRAASAGIDASVVYRSSGRKPLFIYSGKVARTLLAMQYEGDGMGLGTAQWTNGRATVYLNLLLELYGEADYTAEMLYAADVEMYKRELTGAYSKIKGELDKRAGNLEAMMVYTFIKYEAGGGYYRDSYNDNIQTYVNNMPRICGGLPRRFESAKALLDAIRSGGDG